MDSTKTVWAAILGSLIRTALVVIGTRMMAANLISQELLDRLLTEGTAELLGYALVGLAVIWSLRNKIWDFLKRHVALLAPAHTTEAEVAEAVSEMPLGEKLSVAMTSAPIPPSAIPNTPNR